MGGQGDETGTTRPGVKNQPSNMDRIQEWSKGQIVMLEEIRLATWDAFFLEDLSKHIIIYQNMFDIQWLFGFQKTKHEQIQQYLHLGKESQVLFHGLTLMADKHDTMTTQN